MIANNFIGTNATGTAALGNRLDGIDLSQVMNTSILNNVISANQAGVELLFSTAVVQGNLIGTDETGQVALGNKMEGILVQSSSGNVIGGTGTGQGNVIDDNGGNGIRVAGDPGNRITRNSMFGNNGPAIDLNGLFGDVAPAPVLTFTPETGSTGTLSGTVSGGANQVFTIEIFSNPSLPPPGVAEGQTFVQDVTVKTDGSGAGAFSVTLPIGIYAATTTDANGNTSVYANAVASQGLPASVTAVSSSPNASTVGQQVTFTAVVTAPGFAGSPTGTVTFSIDGLPQSPVQLSIVGGVDEAVFTTSTLSAGSHTVSASYSGDANVSASSGSLPIETVTAPGLHATTTTLAASRNPSTVGQGVTFTAIVSPGGSAGNPTGSVIFTIDGVSQAPVSLHVVKGSDEATLSLASLAAGTHTINAAYSGDSSFAASSVAHTLVQTVRAAIPPGVDGPKVELVQRFGIHMQPTSLVLTFDEALDPASAASLRNYRLVDPHGRSVRISSAVFDAKTNTVTLRPAERINLHHTYHLTVIGTGPGGVRNAQGLLLDGTDGGTPDSNYNCSLTWRNVVLTAAELTKYMHRSQAKPAGALNHQFHKRSH
jgi:hypothetical protein